jgi:hypothetical protein
MLPTVREKLLADADVQFWPVIDEKLKTYTPGDKRP